MSAIDTTPAAVDTARLNRTELGLAERIVATHGHRMRWVDVWGKWLLWDGRRWAPDDRLEHVELAKRVVRSIYLEAADEPDEAKRAALADFARGCEKAAKIEAALRLARASLAVVPEDLDADPWVLNTPSGVVDLRTGEVLPHEPERLITKITGADFDPAAASDLWAGFLDRIFAGDADLIGFVRRAMGYAATGSTREHVVLIAHGGGANGKSVLVDACCAALGDYATRADPELLLTDGWSNHPTGVADLKGARLAVCSETDQGRGFAEARLKNLTGETRMKARRMRQDFFEFEATHTLLVQTNHLPDVRGDDLGVWRRIRLIPFGVTIPPAERDHQLGAKLAEHHLPAVLAWIVAGAREWMASGLAEPKTVREATRQYRRDSDTLGRFLEDRCERGERLMEQSAKLHRAYLDWWSEPGVKPLSVVKFARALEGRGFRKTHTMQGKVWQGLQLREGEA